MRRPPRNPRDPLFGRSLVGWSLLQGASVLLILSAVFLATLEHADETEARALTFTTLIVANLALILTNRSWSRTLWASLRVTNRALWWVVASALGMLGAVLYVPALREIFRMAPLHGDDLLLCLGAGVVGVVWFEVVKMMRRG
jgi:Ca2+-transporting ATPase